MGTLLGNMAVGSIVKLKMNGSAVNFIVVHQGYPDMLYDTSCDGTWLMVYNPLSPASYDTGEKTYAECQLNSYLNGEVLNMFDPDIRSLIKKVRIPYAGITNSPPYYYVCTGSSGAPVKLFLPSVWEVGGDRSVYSLERLAFIDGAKLDYFEYGITKSAINKRMSPTGENDWMWTRTARRYVNGDRLNVVWCTSKNFMYDYQTVKYYVRFMLILPQNMQVDESGNITANVAPTIPSSITVPEVVRGGQSLTVSWGRSSDPDGNLAGYRLERSVNGGNWAQIYDGAGLSFVDTITYGWGSVCYRARAYDTAGEASDYITGPVRTVINNSAPSAPDGIHVPEGARGGQPFAVNWGAAADVDGNLAGYRLERSVNGGGWLEVYAGPNLSYTDTLARGWQSVCYRVQAYDAENALSGWTVGAARSITNNLPPVISGADGALGLKNAPFSVGYSVSDPDGDGITVTERLDGVVLQTFPATAGTGYTLAIDANRLLRTLNGAHTLTVTAADNYGGGSLSSVRTWTWSKDEPSFSLSLSPPLPADAAIERCVANISRQIPAGAVFKTEICNNGYDAQPAWEDCTEAVTKGQKFFLKNKTKTAEKWGFNIRVTVQRGSAAAGSCSVTGGGGNFE